MFDSSGWPGWDRSRRWNSTPPQWRIAQPAGPTSTPTALDRLLIGWSSIWIPARAPGWPSASAASAGCDAAGPTFLTNSPRRCPGSPNSPKQPASPTHPTAELTAQARSNVRMTPAQWNDEPISGSAEDAFDRSGHADMIANLIDQSHTWESSLVFGLTGPWGSGKSSLIEMITESLDANPHTWHIARFTPWAANDITGLISEFYACIGETLPTSTGNTVRSSLATLAKLSSPALALIPFIGGSASKVADIAQDRLSEQKPWRKAFDEAVAALKAQQTRVLVIADDIDRLQPDELMAVLKVVRLLGRFPGVQYLLAYDERTLFRTLEASGVAGKQNGSAERFIEKIVQYPVTVPPLLEFQLTERLNAGIDSALTGAGRSVTQLRRLSQSVDIFRRRLATPRAIDRFVAQLQYQLPMLPHDEINDTDVILLTLLRVAFPSIYHELPAWRTILLTGKTNEIEVTGQKIGFKAGKWSDLLSDVPENSRSDAELLLVALFPKLSDADWGQAGGGERQRICDEKYFDRYFTMGVPRHDISDSEVSRIVALAVSGVGTELHGLLTDDKAKADLFITKARAGDDLAGVSAEQRLTLVRMLNRSLPSIPEDTEHIFGGLRHRVTYWAVSLIVDLVFDQSIDPDEVDAALNVAPFDDRLEIWNRVIGDSKMALPSPKAPWIEVLGERMCERATAAFLDNVRQGDSAPTGQPALFYVNLAVNSGGVEKIRIGVADLIRSGTITLADAAARFVTVAYYLGVENPTGHMKEVVQEWWNLIAPQGPDDLYSRPKVSGLDKSDLSWANRREYVKGRIREPRR